MQLSRLVRSKMRFIRHAVAAMALAAMASLLPDAAPASAPLGNAGPSALAVYGRQFAEPLVPTKSTTGPEDAALTAAISRSLAITSADPALSLAPLQDYIASHPTSGWRLALLTNLGLSYAHEFYFTRALDAFEQAWKVAQSVESGPARPLADRAAGELLHLHAKLGHAERLAALLDQMAKRGLSGPATELHDNAKDALWLMRNNPNRAFRCGPEALKAVLRALGKTQDEVRAVDAYKVGAHGTNLAELAALAETAKTSPQVMYRDPGAPVPVPSVLHWRSGHFAAIIGTRDGRYKLVDPTHWGEAPWVSKAALDAEGSGYYLAFGVKPGPGVQLVAAGDARQVFGAGEVGDNYNPSETTQMDTTAQNTTGSCHGMCTYAFLEMSVSLSLRDTPVGYVPPRGPAVPINITYTQREASQPATMAFFNISPKWTLNWLTYIQDDPANPGSNVSRYAAGGGSVPYSGYDSGTGSFSPDLYDGSIVTYTSGAQPGYQRALADGSMEIYAVSNGAKKFPRLIFLSQIIDPAGNALSLNYDNQLRLTSITDATGRNTIFVYANTSNPLLVTSIADPFGRSAVLNYDSSGRLIQITDVLGLTSVFTYDSNSLVNSLTTPYGTTNFSYADANGGRYLQATDPLGNTERVEFREQAPGIADAEAAVPSGLINPVNQYLEYRDTFYWDKHAYAVGHGNYTMARMRHWAHDASGLGLSNTLESERSALEGRIWYNYPGQSSGFLSGTSLKPIVTARLLDDGSTQLNSAQYNAMSNPTQMVDPMGRVTMLQYAPNQLDVTSVQQNIARGPATIAAFTYNGQHKPLTYTDAAGQTTHFTYNAAGQLATQTDALGHVTSYTYDSLGYLLTIVNADGKTAASFTYDTFGRVATRKDSEGWKVSYSYDALDRLTQETYLDHTTRTYLYNKLDLQSVTDRQGRTTMATYDAVRNLIAVSDPMQEVTQYGYYENRIPKTLVDPNGNVTTWPIDVEGRTTGKTYANGSTYTDTYEASTSRLHAVTDPLGQSKIFSYMLDDSLAGITYAQTVNPTPNVSFTYDPYFTRISSMTDGTGTTIYSYEPVGALGALLLEAENPPFANSAIAYQYDALGRLVARSIGGDAEQFAYDALGRVSSHKSDLGNFGMAYLGETSQMTRRSSGFVGTRWLYNGNANDRRLRAIVNTPVASRYAYSTTPENDISAISEDGGYQVWSFANDKADRLTSASSSLGNNYQFAYDAASNLGPIQAPSDTNSVASNNLNQVATFGTTLFKYDANGNLLADYARTYQWDAENRLIGISYPSMAGAATQISYDGLGRRISITDNSGMGVTQIHYGWCSQTLCQARNSTDALEKRYLAEGEVGATSGSFFYYGIDQLGSVRDAIAAGSGLRQRHNDYGPYGNLEASVGAPNVQTDFAYAGLFKHSLSGLYLATYRAYDPAVGRWLSRDPLSEAAGFNLYRYTDGNSIAFVDPMGLCDETANSGPPPTTSTQSEFWNNLLGPGGVAGHLVNYITGLTQTFAGGLAGILPAAGVTVLTAPVNPNDVVNGINSLRDPGANTTSQALCNLDATLCYPGHKPNQ